MKIAITGLARGENPQPGAAIIKSLRNAKQLLQDGEEIEIVGLVYDAQESGIYCEESPDVVYTIPYPSSGRDTLLERYETIQAEQDIDFLIPTLDAEFEPYILMKDQLEQLGMQVILPSMPSYQKRSKAKLPELCHTCGVKTPHTIVVQDAAEAIAAAESMTFPAFIKGPFYDAYQVFSTMDLASRCSQLLSTWGGPLLLQAAHEGSEFNYMGVAQSGNIITSCTVRKTVTSSKGKGYGGVTIDDKSLTAQAEKLIKELKWDGPFELEFIKNTHDSNYYLLEMNPRFPAWVDVATQLGVNMPELLLQNLNSTNEKKEAAATCPAGHFFLRHNVDIVGDISDIGSLLADGSLTIA